MDAGVKPETKEGKTQNAKSQTQNAKRRKASFFFFPPFPNFVLFCFSKRKKFAIASARERYAEIDRSFFRRKERMRKLSTGAMSETSSRAE
jgi:hypothetical protein